MLVHAHQMAAFRVLVAADFEERAIVNVCETLASHCAGMSREAIRSSVRRAAEEAETYGLYAQSSLITFIRAKFVLGCDFLADSRWRYLRNIFENRSISQIYKTEQLMHAVSRQKQREKSAQEYADE